MSIEFYITYMTDNSIEQYNQWEITGSGTVGSDEFGSFEDAYQLQESALEPGELLIRNVNEMMMDSDIYYVPSGTITPRPVQTISEVPADLLINTLNEDTSPEAVPYDLPTQLTLSGIVSGSTFSIREGLSSHNTSYPNQIDTPITGTTLSISGFYDGTYDITIDQWPYVEHEISYTSSPPGGVEDGEDGRDLDSSPIGNPSTSAFIARPYDIDAVTSLTGKSTVKGIVLEWASIIDPEYKEMNIYRRTGSDAYAKIGFAQAASQYTDAAVVSGVNYDYKVRPYSTHGIEYADSNLVSVTSVAVEQEDLGDSIGGDNYDFSDATDFVVTNYLNPTGSEILWYKFLIGDSATNGLLATIDPVSEIKDPSYVFNTTNGSELNAEVVFKIYEQPVGTADPSNNLTLKATSPTFTHWKAVEGIGVTISDLLLSWTYTFGISSTQQYVLGVFYDKNRDASLDALSMVSSLRAYNIQAA